MRAKGRLLAGAAFAAWTFGGVLSAVAQGRPPANGGGGGGEAVSPRRGGSLEDLGKAADRFKAWEVAKLGGAESFSKDQVEVREEFQKLIKKIRSAAVEDRLTGKEARSFLSDALDISEGAANEDGSVIAQIEDVEASVDSAITDTAAAETLTPALNKLQWMIGEALLYGSRSGELSRAKVSSIKKKLNAIEAKEKKAKVDQKLTDLERRRLDEGTLKIWQLVVKGLRGRDD